MQNPADYPFWILRLELLLTDFGHLLILLGWSCIIVAISLYAYHFNKGLVFAFVPIMCYPIPGLVIRMDSMIRRDARLLLWLGDLREAYKIADKTPNFIPVGDVYCLLPIVALLCYALYRSWIFFGQYHWSAYVAYLAIVAVILSFGVKTAIQAASGSITANQPSLQEVQSKIPKHLP